MLACALLVSVVPGCATTYVRIGKPDRPPVAEIAVEESLYRLGNSLCVDPGDPEISHLETQRDILAYIANLPSCLVDGDPLLRFLHEVQNYGDYVMELRGEGYVEADRTE